MVPIAVCNGSRPLSCYSGSSRRGVASTGVVVISGRASPRSPRCRAKARRKRDLGNRQGAEMSRAKLRRFFRHGLLPQLFVFEAVARLGSVTKAAAELHLAQPTVSLQIKKLADTLELTLFEQQGRSLQITPAGRALHEVCRELSALFARAEDLLST